MSERKPPLQNLEAKFVFAYHTLHHLPGGIAQVGQYDVLFTFSERVGTPLAWLGVNKPVVTVFHHSASPIKRHLVRLTGAHKK